MNLNNCELNYLQGIDNKFRIYLKSNNITLSKNLDSLIFVICFIETLHRKIIWRAIEYAFLIINVFLHNLHLKIPIINLSIGKYQIKINYLFDYLKIQYLKTGKRLYSGSIISIINILKIYTKTDVIIDTICHNIEISNNQNLSDGDIYNLLLFYSRNIEFTDQINYYTVFQYLLKKYSA